jgi:hypothetical protein
MNEYQEHSVDEIADVYTEKLHNLQEALISLRSIMESDPFIEWRSDSDHPMAPGFDDFGALLTHIGKIHYAWTMEQASLMDVQEALDEMVQDGTIEVAMNDKGEIVYKAKSN